MPGSFLPDLPFSDPVLIFALVTLIIFVGPVVFQRLRIPGIVGLIVFGALVGPSAAGFLERDSTMILLGTVGLLYLMFYAGLSLNLSEFSRVRGRSIGFGFISFGLPALLAWWVGTQYLDYTPSTSLLLGSIVGSHTLLAFPVARRLGITDNAGITMAIGGTMVADILSLTVLALVVASMEGGMGPLFLGTFALSVGIFVSVLYFGVPPLGRAFFRAVRNEPTTEYGFLLVVLFVSAYTAQLVGLAPIIGAFLAGLVLNPLVPESGTLMSRVQFVGDALLIPFFLISVGLLVDFGVLVGSLEVWIAAGVFTGLVLVGKFLAAMLAKLVLRQSWDEGWVNFGLTVPQAAATLAVTLVGFELGIFTEAMVNGVVIMILITCFLGPWLVERFGRRVALADEDKPFDTSRIPERILIPLANPATSEALMALALMIRERRSAEPLFPLTVHLEEGPELEARVAEGEKMLSHAVVHAAAANVPVRPVTRVDRNIVAGIRRAVVEELISTVIIGWAGRPTTRDRIFGTVLDQLLDAVPQGIWVCKVAQALNVTQRVLLAVPPFAERQPGFEQAMTDMKTMAAQLDAELVIFCRALSRGSIERRVKPLLPAASVRYVPLGSWSEVVGGMKEMHQENDLVALLSARRGSLAWQSGLNTLPQTLAGTFPDQNIIIVFPSRAEVVEGAGDMAPQPPPLKRPLPELDHRLELPPGAFPEILDPLLEPVFPGDEETRLRVAEVLQQNNKEYSHEVWPGSVLLDAHCAPVKEPRVVVGISDGGVTFPGIDHPVHLIVVVLSPDDFDHMDHVRALARVADLLRTRRTLDFYRTLEVEGS